MTSFSYRQLITNKFSVDVNSDALAKEILGGPDFSGSFFSVVAHTENKVLKLFKKKRNKKAAGDIDGSITAWMNIKDKLFTYHGGNVESTEKENAICLASCVPAQLSGNVGLSNKYIHLL